MNWSEYAWMPHRKAVAQELADIRERNTVTIAEAKKLLGAELVKIIISRSA